MNLSTTGGIDKLLLTGEEEGCDDAGDFKLNQRIRSRRQLRLFCAPGLQWNEDEDFIVRHVLEYYFAVVGRLMEICFSFLFRDFLLSEVIVALVGRVDS